MKSPTCNTFLFAHPKVTCVVAFRGRPMICVWCGDVFSFFSGGSSHPWSVKLPRSDVDVETWNPAKSHKQIPTTNNNPGKSPENKQKKTIPPLNCLYIFGGQSDKSDNHQRLPHLISPTHLHRSQGTRCHWWWPEHQRGGLPKLHPNHPGGWVFVESPNRWFFELPNSAKPFGMYGTKENCIYSWLVGCFCHQLYL